MSDDQQSSLELLLDTITNAFGGIVFLALLVVVLLQLTTEKSDKQPPQQATVDELAALETELAAATAERSRLLLAIDVQGRLAQQLAVDSQRHDLNRLEQLRQLLAELNADRLTLANAMVAQQNEINDLAQALSDLDEKLKLKEAEVDDARRKLDAELQSRTTTAKLPRMHETTKMEVVVVLRYGRLYFLHRYTDSPYARELNTDDMVVVAENANELVATPKPYAGLLIDNSPVARRELSEPLRVFPPSSNYLAIAVWEDSFEKFIDLKNMLVELGYEYRVLPTQVGEELTESSDVTPLVQ